MTRTTYIQLLKSVYGFIICILLLLPLTSHAQSVEEKLHSMRVAYLTNRLNLSTEISQKFWPIYNEYLAEKDEIMETISKSKSVSAADVEIVKQTKSAELKKKYNELFKAVLTDGQIGELYQAEKDFKLMIIKQAQSKRP